MTGATQLVRYEAARAALQAAHDVDEVKEIRDKAQAMAAYAKQANDTALVEWATEIKVRAERRAGEMLASMKVNGARHDAADNLKSGPKSPDGTSGPTLDSLGISKNQASRWQRLAAVPEDQFEQAVAAAKEVAGEVTTAALLRAARPPQEIRQRETEVVPAGTMKNLGQQTQAKIETIQALNKARSELQEEREAHAATKESLAEMADLAASAKAFEEKQEFKEMQVLRTELRSAKRRRDELMAENAQLKTEVKRWRTKAEGKKK